MPAFTIAATIDALFSRQDLLSSTSPYFARSARGVATLYAYVAAHAVTHAMVMLLIFHAGFLARAPCVLYEAAGTLPEPAERFLSRARLRRYLLVTSTSH